MAITQIYMGTLNVVTCCRQDCGVKFGLDADHQTELRRTHAWFYCPNGHQQHYSAETEEERLKRDLKRMTDSRDYHENRGNNLQLSANALRGVITKHRKRVGNGVCPCCNRTFRQLAAHMKTKHPNYHKPVESKL